MLRTLRQVIKVGIVSERAARPESKLAKESDLSAQIHQRFGRALGIRHVDAGSCNGCELEIHAVNNPYYNLEGFGIKFVASPRHADLLLVTGPVSRHMESALKRVYDATPDPKWVIAVGDCGCTGGIFGTGYAIRGPVADIIPVDLTVPGCPPPPAAILSGIVSVVMTDRR
ncbi:MAG: NADH-quinone oxidoreductase subunit B family protein [Acidiferrobacteraceae bacterium]